MEENKTETALAVGLPGELDRQGYEPANTADAFQLAKWVVSSRFYPAFDAPEKAFMVLAKGRELGFTALASLDLFDIINGRLAMRALAMVALLKKAPACKYLRLIEDTPEKCTWETKRRDDPDGPPARASFSIDEAKQAGYLSPGKDGKLRDQWVKQPQVMMVWRALSKLAKREYADVLMGMPMSEELRDIIEDERAVDITPPAAVASTAAEAVHSAIKATSGNKAKAKAKEEESEDLKLITKMQHRLIELVGPERAREVWYSNNGGPGKISKEMTNGQLAHKHDVAADLLNRFETAAQIETIRAAASKRTGEVFEPLPDPAKMTLAEITKLLDDEAERLSAPDQTVDQPSTSEREPGADG